LVCCLAFGTTTHAEPRQDEVTPLSPEIAAKTQKAIDRGLTFLHSTQDKDGGWTAMYGPAVTAIVAKAFAQDKNYGPRPDRRNHGGGDASAGC